MNRPCAVGTRRSRKAIPAATLVLLLASCTSMRAQPLVQTEVFVGSHFGGSEGYYAFRIPALIRAANGDLLAFAEGRKSSLSDSGNIDLVVKRSTDAGQTWGPLRIVYEEGGSATITIGNPCPVVDQATGRIWLAMCRNNLAVLMTYSDDHGQTWATPTDITADVRPPVSNRFGTGPGHAIQLSSGRLLFPCWINEHLTEASLYRSFTFYSDDHGATWHFGGIAGEVTNECLAVELTDGRVLMNMRRNSGPQLRRISHSSDGGVTWTAAVTDPTLITPTCQASIVRFTTAAQQDRDRLLFANPASTTARENLTVRVSHDEGATWSAGQVVYAGLSSYSDLCPLSATQCGLLYERGDAQLYERIVYARFTLAWVDEDYEPPTRFIADFDADEDVDMEDFGHFQACLTGPSFTIPMLPGCADADLDGDGLIYLPDVTIFTNCLAGANVGAGQDCPRVLVDDQVLAGAAATPAN